jgi:hypothetical protein
MEKEQRAAAAIGTWPTPERPARVSIPAKVAFDLKTFQKVQASILDRLGCPACCSGWDIRWDTLQSFRVDERLDIQPFLKGGVE